MVIIRSNLSNNSFLILFFILLRHTKKISNIELLRAESVDDVDSIPLRSKQAIRLVLEGRGEENVIDFLDLFCSVSK